jgi:P27 family predicted phage terminase small subunit
VSRRPKPTFLKEIAGNPGGRPLNMQEPKPPSGVPEMPKGMGVAAKRHWRKWTHQLLEVGVMTTVDGVALEQACVSAALAEKYRNVALAEPMVNEPVTSKDGELVGFKTKPNPAFAAYIAASKNVKAYLIEFGLTPASRAKLKIDKEPDEDDMPSKDQTTLPGEEVDLSTINLEGVQ